jgi:branched-chain amino acid aminotransferase
MSEVTPEAVSWTWLDGQVLPTAEARIGVLDRGFLYGDSVFETLRTIEGRGLFLKEHLDRLRKSLARLEIDFQFKDPWMEQRIDQLVQQQIGTEVVLRITVTRGDRIDGALEGSGCQPRLVVMSSPITSDPPSHPLKLVISSRHKTPPAVFDPTIKSGNYLGSIRARDEAKAAGADDAVLLSPDGVVTELTCANLFWITDGTAFTCDDALVLNGITRSVVIRLLEEQGVEVRVGRFSRFELNRAGEAFATSSIQGVRAIGSLEGRSLESDAPASLCKRLIEQYQQYCQQVMTEGAR